MSDPEHPVYTYTNSKVRFWNCAACRCIWCDDADKTRCACPACGAEGRRARLVSTHPQSGSR